MRGCAARRFLMRPSRLRRAAGKAGRQTKGTRLPASAMAGMLAVEASEPMRKTTIMLPPTIHQRAAERARERGVSLAGLVRELLETELEGPRKGTKKDPLFKRHVYRGPAPRTGA